MNSKPSSNGKARQVAPPLQAVSTVGNGHDARGRFTKGNQAACGNPITRKMAQLRTALVTAIDEHKIETLADRLYQQALAGDVPAASLLLRYCVGRPAEAVDPDSVNEDEWRRLKDMPSRQALLVASVDSIPTDEAIDGLRKLLAAQEAKRFGPETPKLREEDVIAEREERRRWQGRQR
jgi:hypothetical protein